MTSPWTRVALAALAAVALPAGALAEHLANHLVITEAGYDTATESSASTSSEYVEIFNPTSLPIVLNQGAVPGTANGKASYFISDSKDYYKVVNGKVSQGSNPTDFVYQFPADIVIPPRGTIVVCADSTTFLNEFYAGDLAKFQALPGSPQLLEAKQDGATDGIPDMVPAYSNTSNAQAYLSLTNSGEPLVLFRWDGQADLVQDVDLLVWLKTTEVINKSGVTVDGPDEDTTASAFAADSGRTTLLGAATTANTHSLQRRNLQEPGEAATGGNGVGGHDETSEEWSGATNPTWGADVHSPGLQYVRSDASLTDALSFLAPLAISTADGDPTSTASPKHYGKDGTLTELYATPIDTDKDRVPDGLYVALRGSMFGEPNGNSNASFVLVDLDPGTPASGVNGRNDKWLDATGLLDGRLSSSRFQLAPAWTNVAFDAAVGLDAATPATADEGGWRSWGSGGTAGRRSDFAWLPDPADANFDPKFHATISPLYAGAAGTNYRGEDGFEAWIPYSKLTSITPRYAFLVGVTTTDNGTGSSANTVPESTGDAHDANPQVIDRGVCLDLVTGKAVTYFVDTDHDGFGSTTVATYCGAPSQGVSLTSDDCDDTNGAVKPGATETCDGRDNDCSGGADEGLLKKFYLDADGDTFGGATVVETCTAPAKHVELTGDCNDTDAAVKPGATEVCDGKDNDCANGVDDGVTTTFYGDLDGDGFGDATETIAACTAPADYVANDDDCLDTDETVKPGGTEVCDGKDNDCANGVDDGVGETYYADADGDGYGSGTGAPYCTAQQGKVTQAGDCDDANAAVKPGATETCDQKDNDCDGSTDEDVGTTYYRDLDGDGFGGSTTVVACSQPGNTTAQRDDCDDTDADVKPTATEACDGVDNDCDADVDEGVKTTFFLDADQDGSGAPGTTTDACEAPAGYVANADDCDDAEGAVKPGADEACDGVDNDCDGDTDEDVGASYFADGDQDGFGSGGAVLACEPPAGHVGNANDCNDADAAIKPGAEQLCDGIDNACSGGVPANEADADADGQRVCAGDCNDENPNALKADKEANCGDSVDNDCDGKADQLDSDCASPKEEPRDESGCGCASGSSATGFMAFGLIIGLAALRPRRRRA